MSSGQDGDFSGTQDAQRGDHSLPAPQEAPTTNGCSEVDHQLISPELRALLEEGVAETGLEIDEDADGDEEEGEDQDQDRYCDDDGGSGEAGFSDEENAHSVYAMSMYPGVQPAHQVEHPYESGHDSATIDSARTLYAEDFDFVIEHGRQYCGDYFLPIDQTEQTRQYVIHQVYLKVFNLELTTVPLEDPRYILDIGTGIGEWAIGMAEKYPRCEVFGTDIAPIQPTHQVPFNVEFHIENAEEEWIRPANTVDLVHIRNMYGAFSDWSFIYREAFACIKPGGWIEVIDWADLFADKNYLTFFPDGSAMRTVTQAWLDAAAAAGRRWETLHPDTALLWRAGFADVRETIHDLAVGSRGNSSYGKFWLFTLVTGTEPYCLRMLTRHLGWDADDVRDLCDKAAREIQRIAEDPAHAEEFVVKLRVVVARKPLAAAGGDGGGGGSSLLNEWVNGEVDAAQSGSGDDSTIGQRTIRSDETS